MARGVYFQFQKILQSKLRKLFLSFFLNNCPFNRSFEYFYYLLLSIFLLIGKGGGWDTLAWAAWPPPMETRQAQIRFFFHHFKHKFLKHRHCSNTCFYQLFSLRESVKVKILWPVYGKELWSKYWGPRNLLPTSEYLVNKAQKKNFPFNKSFEFFYYLL